MSKDGQKRTRPFVVKLTKLNKFTTIKFTSIKVWAYRVFLCLLWVVCPPNPLLSCFVNIVFCFHHVLYRECKGTIKHVLFVFTTIWCFLYFYVPHHPLFQLKLSVICLQCVYRYTMKGICIVVCIESWFKLYNYLFFVPPLFFKHYRKTINNNI